MIAVFVNMSTVVIGSLLGIFFRGRIRQRFLGSVMSALALVTMSIGICSIVKSAETLCLIVSMALGTILGELLRIDDRIEGAGDFIKSHVLRGKTAEGSFTEGFVSACILFCVGSMSIMGSFEAGINGDYSIIFAKSALDFVSALAFGAAMGIGVTFSAVFILLYQGGLTLLASAVAPYIGSEVVVEMSAAGGAILVGMGINMLELTEKRIKVANMLPAIFIPIVYFPLSRLISGML